MLRYMTAGESHGKGLMAILDGVPAGLRVDETFINSELARRMYGYGRGGRMRIEKDKAELFTGLRKGKTIGSPIGILVMNKDHKIDELPAVKNPRPGHADLAGMQKYGLADARDVLERASARESAARVAIGAVAKLFLKEFLIRITSHVTGIAGIMSGSQKLSFDEILQRTSASGSKLRCADPEAEKKMCDAIDAAEHSGDTLGGEFEVLADNLPPGLGSYAQWDSRLDGRLARALMSIPAVKAVSLGEGIQAASKKGSQVHDPIVYDKGNKSFSRTTNNAGGIEGGMTNGGLLRIHGFMKPIATLKNPLSSVDMNTKAPAGASTERSDVTAVPACGVIGESVVALELACAMLEKFGGDSIEETKRNFNAYLAAIKEM